MVILKLLGSKMEYNKKEQLLDKVSGLKYINPSGQGFYHNKALDTACVHIKEFFNSEFVPEVPQYVANWYEINKFDLEYNIWSYIFNWKYQSDTSFKTWMNNAGNKPIQTLINMKQFGYKVKEDKKYIVKMVGLSNRLSYLNYNSIDDEWYFNDADNGCAVGTYHTKKQLEDAGFSNVFDNPMFEVKEV